MVDGVGCWQARNMLLLCLLGGDNVQVRRVRVPSDTMNAGRRHHFFRGLFSQGDARMTTTMHGEKNRRGKRPTRVRQWLAFVVLENTSTSPPLFDDDNELPTRKAFSFR